jgi:hypothetical protein
LVPFFLLNIFTDVLLVFVSSASGFFLEKDGKGVKNLSLELDILLAAMKFYSKMAERWEAFDIKVLVYLVSTYYKLLEYFLLCVQQMLMEEGDGLSQIFSKKVMEGVDICLIVNKLFTSPRGQAIMKQDQSLLKKYERSFRMCINIMLNVVDLEDELPGMRKYIIFEVFR